MNTKKIVITGGPSTGKTAVVEKLETLGYTCLHEVIRTMTLEKKAEEDTVTFKSNPIVSVSDPVAFNTRILKARVAQYHTSNEIDQGVIFFDRGIPDVLAYMDCFGQHYKEGFTKACLDHPYDLVFLMPPWKEIYISDNGRFESYEESLLVHKCLQNTYEQFGYNIITIPKETVIKRVDFILDCIKALK